MDGLLIAAGCLGLIGTATHGGAGEVLVVRRLALDTLPPTRFGGPRTTKTMIHVSWHLTTVAFLTVACALLLSGTVLDGDAAQALALVAAAASTGFAVLTLAIGAAYARSARALIRHPGPVLLSVTAVLAWWGAA